MLSSEKKSEKNRVFERTKKMRSQTVDLGELLPHDKMAEQAVLGAIIIQNSILLPILDILTTDDFFSPANHCIFAAMQEMTAQEPPVPIDELTLLSHLKSKHLLDQTGGIDYLNELSPVSYTHLTLPTTPYV